MRRGFTLIELLSVIVILAVISLIVTPITYSVIESSEKKSYEITCNEIFRSYNQYDLIIDVNDVCNVIDFASEREEIEVIDNIKYIPVSKLELEGKLPIKGTYKVCNNKKNLVIYNGKYTCIKDENNTEIKKGDYVDSAIKPIIDDIILTSTTNSIKVVVNVNSQNNDIKNYYYKINGIETSDKANNKIFENLEKDTEYEIEVLVEDKNGLKSDPVSKKIKTKDINDPIIKLLSKTPENYSWSTTKIVQINYNNTSDYLNLYFKTSVESTVTNGTVVSSCGTGIEPSNCINSSVTTLVPNTWYRTNNMVVNVIYKDNGSLYASITDTNSIIKSSTYGVTKIDNVKPTKPIITGGNTSWTNNSRTINISQESTAKSGISKYQYYISTSSTTQTGGSWKDGKSIIVVDNGIRYVYMRSISNSGLISDVSNYQVTKVDRQNPTVTVSVSGKVATFTVKDNIGVIGYGINQSTTIEPTYTSINSTTSSTLTYTGSSAGNYVVWVKDNAGGTAKTSFTLASSAFNYTATKTESRYNASCSTNKNGYTACERCHCQCMHGGENNTPQGASHCNYDLNNGITIKWIQSCPNGGYLDGNMCVTGTTTNCSCPNGGTLSGTTCIKTTYTCPDGGTLSGTMCIR